MVGIIMADIIMYILTIETILIITIIIDQDLTQYETIRPIIDTIPIGTIRALLQALGRLQEIPIAQEILVHQEEHDKADHQVQGLQILIEEDLQTPILIEEDLRQEQAQDKWEADHAVWEAEASAEVAEEDDKRRFYNVSSEKMRRSFGLTHFWFLYLMR